MQKLLVLMSLIAGTSAFAPSLNAMTSHKHAFRIFSTEGDSSFDEPRRNPDKPELPEIKGDFDWDAKFAGDDDWIVENVPGKIVLSDIELARQNTALTKIEEKYRKIRLAKEYDDARILGWTGRAEMFNGRFAMFFLSVGLLTEYWTGISIPGQIEEMLRVGGFIGPDFG